MSEKRSEQQARKRLLKAVFGKDWAKVEKQIQEEERQKAKED